MTVRVVNVSGMNKPETRAGVCYVGRPFAGWKGHALANPFKFVRGDNERTNAASLAFCLHSYREWLAARQTLAADLARLWEECEHGGLPLGCWCVNAETGDGQPIRCHAQILAEMLQARFCCVPVAGAEERAG
jgi:hypothetical protein